MADKHDPEQAEGTGIKGTLLLAMFRASLTCFAFAGLAAVFGLDIGPLLAAMLHDSFFYVPLPFHQIILLIAVPTLIVDVIRATATGDGTWWVGSLAVLAVAACEAFYFSTTPWMRDGVAEAMLATGCVLSLGVGAIHGGAKLFQTIVRRRPDQA